MSNPKTIAFSGKPRPTCLSLLKQLGKAGNRLLLFMEEKDFIPVSEDFQKDIPALEMENMECLKDSCWEADFIILDGQVLEHTALINNIKEVATQKPVLFLEEENLLNSENTIPEILKELLPHSFIYQIKPTVEINEVAILTTERFENPQVTQLFLDLGYKVHLVNRDNS